MCTARSIRWSPGKPTTVLIAGVVVGGMHESSASVGSAWSNVNAATCPVASTCPPITPLSRKHSRNFPPLHVSNTHAPPGQSLGGAPGPLHVPPNPQSESYAQLDPGRTPPTHVG